MVTTFKNIGDGNINENIKDINGNNVGQHYIENYIRDYIEKE